MLVRHINVLLMQSSNVISLVHLKQIVYEVIIMSYLTHVHCNRFIVYVLLILPVVSTVV
jgi:hypothetical protein